MKSKIERLEYIQEVVNIKRSLIELGVESFPTKYIKKYRPNTDFDTLNQWTIRMRNTYDLRVTPDENLEILKKVLKDARKDILNK